MRIGVLSDLHGNVPALNAVVEDMPPVDALVCAGDVVGYNPWPTECVAFVRERNVPTVRGNHDRAVATDSAFRFNAMASAGVAYARERLTAEELDWLGSLPETRLEFDGRVRIVHGHPDDPDRYTYPGDFGPSLLGDEDVLVLGHTHVQHAAEYAEGIIVNPGSVGQPRDGDPRAAYAVVDLESRTVETRRVAYDVDAVRQAIDDAGLPARLGTRLLEGR